MEDVGDISTLFYEQQSASLGFYITKAIPSEKLPERYSCNYAGFLIKNLKREINCESIHRAVACRRLYIFQTSESLLAS